MRRALSIVLLAVFFLPPLASCFASEAIDDAGVPACCRRHGLHHCVLSAVERAMLQAMGAADPELRARSPICPYQQSAMRTAHPVGSALPIGVAVYASIVSHPTALAQTHSKWRMSRERARLKRGPPAGLLS